jgi:hypothetical protein
LMTQLPWYGFKEIKGWTLLLMARHAAGAALHTQKNNNEAQFFTKD